MRVYELIELLEKCPDRGAFVMYDATEGIRNNALTVYDDMGEEQREPHFSVDDVLVGSGTIRGYVYLTEEREAQAAQREYEAAVKMEEYCERYETTFNAEDGSM